MKKIKLGGHSVFPHLFLIVSSVIFLVPFLMIIIMSVTDNYEIALEGFKFIPKKFSLEAYKYVFSDFAEIGQAALVTIAASAIAPFLSILVNVMVAYPLSREEFKYRGIINKILIFIMFIGPVGMADYVLKTQIYDIENTLLIYILPSCSPWTIFLFRTYFKSVPQSLIESARIDGASEFTVIIKILLPLSKAIFAIQYFLGFIGGWNDYYTSLLYMTDSKFFKIQHLLQNKLNELMDLKRAASEAGMLSSGLPEETVPYVLCIISLIPVIILFPYMQKYFSKGIAVGSVKG